ncbi:MAG: hypothetical protein ABL929_08255, partial [Ferruginibacter sp.]
FLNIIFLYILLSVLLTLLYTLPLWPFSFLRKLQHLGFAKTILLSCTWAYTTVVLPAAFAADVRLIAVALLFVARFLFMFLLCFIFDKRDVVIDKINGLNSLATNMSEKNANIFAIAFVLHVSVGLFYNCFFANTFQAVATIFTSVLLWVVFRFSKLKQGYVFYYFIVDGLMLVSALATFVGNNIFSKFVGQ